jgi:hypothetical protein
MREKRCRNTGTPRASPQNANYCEGGLRVSGTFSSKIGGYGVERVPRGQRPQTPQERRKAKTPPRLCRPWPNGLASLSRIATTRARQSLSQCNLRTKGCGSWADSTGGFDFLIPASSACARSLLVPGTCDLPRRRADARERNASLATVQTRERDNTSAASDASDSAGPGAWTGPHSPAP